MLVQLLSVLPANNGWMPFSDFVIAAREAGVNPVLWRRAKVSGQIEARINDAGVHEVRIAPNGS